MKAMWDCSETHRNAGILEISFVQRMLTGVIQSNTVRECGGAPLSEDANVPAEGREKRGSNQHPRASKATVVRNV